IQSGYFYEVYIDTPLTECERRDPKGLYARARRGEIHSFTGIDSPYEVPDFPEIVVATLTTTPEECAYKILSEIGD
ncbi:adenylylsulfate kinase, partial [Candidatus Magnetomorum sp. HK-1]